MLGRYGLARFLLTALCAVPAMPLSTVAAQTEAAKGAGDEEVLRVCADPHNIPQSNEKGEGYENKLAERFARHLGRRVEYTWFPQRIGFVRNTLRNRNPDTGRFLCDVIIGVPADYELTANTRPYMHSTYGLIYRRRPELEGLRVAEDLLKLPREQLRAMRIGIFAQSPGADWLLRNGLLDRAVPFPAQSGDPLENPTAVIDRELNGGTIDAAIVWGPIAAYLVGRHEDWSAVPFEPDPRIKFDYEIAMGVRFGEKAWRDEVDTWIANDREGIEAILRSYGIPLLDDGGKFIAGFRTSETVRAGSVHKRIPLDLGAR